jgi:hypothetical protein
MKMQQIKIVLALCLCGVGTQAVWAGPMQRSQIPADAAWFVSLDLDRLKTTQVGAFLMAELEKPEVQQKLAMFQALFNFDPRKKLKGCTLYSRGSTPEDAVLLLQGEFDPQRLAALAALGKDFQTSQHRGYTINSWIDQRKNASGGTLRAFGAIHTNGTVLLGQKAVRIGEALDTLDHLQASLETSKALPQVPPSDSVVLIGAARQAGLGQLPPNAAFLKNFKTLCLTAGEAQQNLGAELVIETENEDAARNLVAIGQGLLAWVAMQGDKSGHNRLLQGLATAQTNSLVSLSLKLPAADAVQMLKDAQARKGARRP